MATTEAAASDRRAQLRPEWLERPSVRCSRCSASLAIALAVGADPIIAYGESPFDRLRRDPEVLASGASTASATCWRSRRH